MADEKDSRQITSWSDLFMRTMELGLGAATLTVETAQKGVNELIKRGQMSREEGGSFVDRLMAMGREQREQISDMIEQGVARALDRMDLARRSDVEALQHRVTELERVILGGVPTDGPIPPTDTTDLAEEE